MDPSLREVAGAGAAAEIGTSVRGSAEADLTRIWERSADLASDGSGMSLPLLAGRKGLAAATITFDGAGAGYPSRKVASNMASSLPSIGARPTYSTRTRAKPWP